MKKHARLLIEILIVLVLLGVGFWVCIFTYHQGFDSGYQDGHNDGYKSGHTQGYAQGHQDGYTQGYAQGHSQGYDKGLNDGRNQNANSGYAQGYTDGQTAVTNQWVTWERKWCVSVNVLNAPWQACYTPETP